MDLLDMVKQQSGLFNEPTHLPKPRKPATLEPAQEFDVFDDALMKDCIGGRLTKPVQALLIAHDVQWDHYSKDDLKEMVKALRDAVKDEYRDL